MAPNRMNPSSAGGEGHKPCAQEIFIHFFPIPYFLYRHRELTAYFEQRVFAKELPNPEKTGS